MTQVPVTTSAGYSRALAETPIFRGDNIFGRNRLPETGPASPRIEFRLRRKECRVTANTTVQSRLVQIPIGAGVCHFGIGPAGDVERVRRELLSPLCVAFDNFLHPSFPDEHACGREFSDLNFGGWSTLQRDRGRWRAKSAGTTQQSPRPPSHRLEERRGGSLSAVQHLRSGQSRTWIHPAIGRAAHRRVTSTY